MGSVDVLQLMQRRPDKIHGGAKRRLLLGQDEISAEEKELSLRPPFLILPHMMWHKWSSNLVDLLSIYIGRNDTEMTVEDGLRRNAQFAMSEIVYY